MYHVSNDKRSRKSAELIWEGMKECLQEKSLEKLRITDINQRSFISRATFYRLFDSIPDVLVYECDCIYYQLAQTLADTVISSEREFFLCLIQKWLEQEVLIKTLAENNMLSVLYETHMKNLGLMKQVFLKNRELEEREADYLAAVLAAIIPAAVGVWYQHGRTETPEEIYRAVSGSLHIIEKELF